MSILIKGMEMPGSCVECGVEWCERWKELIIAGMSIAKARPSDCPLVPVTPHGRLIDADVVMSLAMEDILMWEDAGCDRDDYRAFLANYIEDAPTIIEAEEGDT